MPIEIRHFGAGNRRPDGPPGTSRVEAQVIHSDGRGVVAELAFDRRARIAAHENPNTTWFCVIEGGGFVQVGDEQRLVAAGEAVLWPAGVVHAAWTLQTQMRAIVVEFAGPDDSQIRGILEGAVRRLTPGERGKVAKAEGKLTRPGPHAGTKDDETGEPV
jgi:quercetin dioxygenase-like cupin family protein